MANLTGKTIYQTYPSLVGIGTAGTSGVSGAPQKLTDGLGVEIPIEVSTDEVNITADTFIAKSFDIAAYGQVINDQGQWVGPGSAIGSSGTSGTSGTSGSNGSSGTSGDAGSSGTSGTSGQDGSSGTSGQAGSS
jgi:hypothetical protein